MQSHGPEWDYSKTNFNRIRILMEGCYWNEPQASFIKDLYGISTNQIYPCYVVQCCIEIFLLNTMSNPIKQDTTLKSPWIWWMNDVKSVSMSWLQHVIMTCEKYAASGKFSVIKVDLWFVKDEFQTSYLCLLFPEAVSWHHEGIGRGGGSPRCTAGWCQHRLTIHVQTLNTHVW